MPACRFCGVLEQVGDFVICEDCADNLDLSLDTDTLLKTLKARFKDDVEILDHVEMVEILLAMRGRK